MTKRQLARMSRGLLDDELWALIHHHHTHIQRTLLDEEGVAADRLLRVETYRREIEVRHPAPAAPRVSDSVAQEASQRREGLATDEPS